MAGARAAVGRRKASARPPPPPPPPAGRRRNKGARRVRRCGQFICAFRRSASPYFFGGEHFVPFVAKARMRMHRENESLFHLSPEGRGRANEVSEGEGVRKPGIFLVRPSPLTPPSPLRGEGVHDRRANGK